MSFAMEQIKWLPKLPTDHLDLESCWRAHRNTLFILPLSARCKSLYVFATELHELQPSEVPSEFLSNEQIFKSICINGTNIRGLDLPLSFSIEAVRNTGAALAHIPLNQRVAPICDLALNKAVDETILQVPPELRTAERYTRSVQVCPISLQHVPGEYKTPSMCLEAVRKCPRVFPFVPECMMIDDTICVLAMRTCRTNNNFSVVPARFRTAKVYHEALKHGHIKIFDVPENLITVEMCVDALNSIWGSWSDVPQRFHTVELYTALAKKRSSAILKLCNREEVALIVVSHAPEMIQAFPFHHKTPLVCAKVVSSDPTLLEHVPSVLRSESLCAQVVLSYPISDSGSDSGSLILEDSIPSTVNVPDWRVSMVARRAELRAIWPRAGLFICRAHTVLSQLLIPEVCQIALLYL